jgi:integrase
VAERWGVLPDGSNPCRHVERFAEEHRERFLSEQELARLGAALKHAERLGRESDGESPFAVAAVRLLVLTGCRMSEILTLRWQDVDLDAGLLRLPDSKTGKKTVRLNAPARELLAALPRIEGNPFVVVGGRDGEYLKDLERPWRRIRERAALANVRLHDLRHSFASVAAAGGHSLPIIGALLGHTQSATTQRYAHLGADPLRQASEAIGKRLETAMSGQKAAKHPADLSVARRQRRAAR